MNDKKIIEYWNMGFTIDQIVNQFMVVKIAKKKKIKDLDKVQKFFQNKVENTILEYSRK